MPTVQLTVSPAVMLMEQLRGGRLVQHLPDLIQEKPVVARGALALCAPVMRMVQSKVSLVVMPMAQLRGGRLVPRYQEEVV